MGSTQALCSAGWGGWSCTDDAKAQSISVQNLATLLLTLSNLMFLPAIAVAVYRYYLVEASVYTYTMFFSTVGIAFRRVPSQPPPEHQECCIRLQSLVEELLGSLDKHLHGHVLLLQSWAEVLLSLGSHIWGWEPRGQRWRLHLGCFRSIALLKGAALGALLVSALMAALICFR